jgi:hypothetical protein
MKRVHAIWSNNKGIQEFHERINYLQLPILSWSSKLNVPNKVGTLKTKVICHQSVRYLG